MLGKVGGSLGKWARYINANDTSAALTVNQRGSGLIFDCQAGGVSKFSVSNTGAVSITGAITVVDDVLFTLGTDADGVLLNRSTSLNANTALTGVFIGTPVTPALAANTLIIANKTADGDILLAANDGGNSKACLFFDASAPDLILYNVGGTWTAGATTWTIPSVTLGGGVAGGDQSFTNVGDMTFAAGSILASGSTSSNTLLLRANDTTFITFTTGATDTCEIANATITTPILASLYQASGGGLISIPASVGVDTICLLGATQELDGKTIDSAVAKGTWTASGTWTIPAVTLGGAVAGGDQAFTNVGDMTFAAGSILASGSTNGNTLLFRANDSTFITFTTGATDSCTLGTPITLDSAQVFLGDKLHLGDGATDLGVGANELAFTVRSDTDNRCSLRLHNDGRDRAFSLDLEPGSNTPNLQLWYHAGAWVNILNVSSVGALSTILSVDTLTYKVSGTQVVGARVVDAGINDAIEVAFGVAYPNASAVLTALQAGIQAHGLITAA